jgi:DNA-binding GntR family transcriptional regulator
MDQMSEQAKLEDQTLMRRTPLVLTLAARIQDLVHRGDLKVGTKLAAQALADQFQVSRSPIREALNLLAERGVIEQIPNRGFAVRQSPPSDQRSTDLLPLEADQGYYQIAEDWVEDRLPSEVTEQMLRDRYGLTRGQLADILLRATREGWIERKQGYGWRFLPVAKTQEAFEQIYRFRMIIEPMGMLEPTFRLDRAVLADLRRVQEKMLESDIERLPAERLLANGSEFHEELLRLSGNPYLHMSLVRVNRMRRLLEYRAKINRSRLQVQCSDHLRILEALERNELLEASYLMKQHLGGALEHKSPVNWSKLGPANSLSG